jgi:hypothetical protein
MDSIDAVEGTAKALLNKFLDVATENRQDVSEYIQDVKAVIDTVVQFIKNNPAIGEVPESITDDLYNHAKSQWLKRMEQIVDPEKVSAGGQDLEYQAYCYDYIYEHGDYPL